MFKAKQRESKQGDIDKKQKEEDPEDPDLPVDKGWAWMILLGGFGVQPVLHPFRFMGCFLNISLVFGYNRSLSLLFVEFINRFQESATTTTLIMGFKSLSYSIFSLVSMHVVLEFLGTRKTVLLGSTMFSLSILCAAFSPNITVLIVVHFFLGIGQSMIQSPGLVLIGQYFKKRRSLATTTASSAVSFSAGVFPLLTEYLLGEYGLTGTMLLITGMCLNMWVGAALFRPFEYLRKNTTLIPSETKPMLPKHLETDIVENVTGSTGMIDSKVSHGDSFRKRAFSHSDTYRIRPIEGNLARRLVNREKMVYSSDPDVHGMAVSLMDIRKEPTPEVTVQITEKTNVLEKFKTILNAFDFSLFKNPMFILIAVLSHFAVIAKYTSLYIPARVNELGMNQSDAAILLLITGCLDFFCRIFYGFLADLKIIKVHHIMAIGLLVTGLVNEFAAFFTTFPLLVLYSVVTGIFGSAYQCLLPVVIVELMGLKNMAKTLGFTDLFHGLASAVTHPVIGGIRDLSGSYVPCFMYLGSTSIVASLLLLCEPLVRRFSSRQEPGSTQAEGKTRETAETKV